MKNFNKNQADATISQSLSYFSSILAGLETDSNPIYDFPQKISQQAAPNQSISSDFSRIFTPTALTALLATSKVSAKVFFLAAFSYSLAKFSGQDESLFCISPVDNRDRMLPLYLKINEDQRVFEYLDGVQTIYQETIRQTACSFEKLAAELDLKADLRFVLKRPQQHRRIWVMPIWRSLFQPRATAMKCACTTVVTYIRKLPSAALLIFLKIPSAVF